MTREHTGAEARYCVLDRLGQGGMSIVYRATDRTGGQPVALKRLLAEMRDKRVELFHQEYRTLAQLAHPNVVRVDDFGVDAEGPYYTMELLDGDDLHAIAPVPWREACNLVRDVCSALALLHSRRLLHRDLSPRNIKRTSAGQAKLMDFGAMAPMGLQKLVIGTPPFIPPEALLREPLDARADLYALGATLYYALTGRHAYPARRVEDLPATWRSTPAPPSAFATDVPAELDKLVLSLLNTDHAARPRSAAELFDRLNAIAGLPADEQLSVRSAYLSTPELVGRDHEVAESRRQLRKVCDGGAAVMIVSGKEGMGRSRMLDVVVLEAKLAGMAAARAGASALNPYSTIAQLMERFLELQPSARYAEGIDDGLLELLLEGAVASAVDQARRNEISATIAALTRAVAAQQPLLLAIDDFERCDPASQAAIAFLYRACAGERLALALVADAGAPGQSAALSMLREGASVIALPALDNAQIEQLLGSVFGDVPHLAGFALQVGARAEGKPRDCLQLAQYAVERGDVHYEMGNWVLPPNAIDAALPASLSRIRRFKLDALPPDALALAEVLALADGTGLPRAAYLELTEHGDAARVHEAIHTLLLAQIIVQVSSGDALEYSFVGAAWTDELVHGMPAERMRAHCSRIADALARRGRDRLEVAVLRMRAGQADAAIDTVLAELAERGTRWQSGPRAYSELLEACLAACVRTNRPRRQRMALQRELVSVGADLTVPNMRAHYAALFAELRKDACLDDWDALGDGVPDGERLQKAFEATQLRFESADEQERGLAPFYAIRLLTRLVSEASAYASQVSDLEVFASIPSLAPLCVISPAIDRVWNLSTPACRSVIAGRYIDALSMYRRALEGVRTIESSGLDEVTRLWSWYALHYAIGCIEAGLGSKHALECATELERDASWAITAMNVRAAYFGTLGNLREAERWRKALEMASLQSAVKPVLTPGAAHQYVYIASLSDDLPGLRQLVHELETLARLHPTLRSYSTYALAESARVTGRHEEVLEIVDPLLAEIVPGANPLWSWAMGTRLNALVELGRYEEARNAGCAALATAEQTGLDILKDRIIVPLALAEARLGDYARACERVDEVMGWRASDAGGASRGWCLEARARIAMWMDDAAGFERYAAQCGEQYRQSGGNPALLAKHERLLQEGRQRGLGATGSRRQAPNTEANPPSRSSSASTLDDETRIEDGPSARHRTPTE